MTEADEKIKQRIQMSAQVADLEIRARIAEDKRVERRDIAAVAMQGLLASKDGIELLDSGYLGERAIQAADDLLCELENAISRESI